MEIIRGLFVNWELWGKRLESDYRSQLEGQAIELDVLDKVIFLMMFLYVNIHYKPGKHLADVFH